MQSLGQSQLKVRLLSYQLLVCSFMIADTTCQFLFRKSIALIAPRVISFLQPDL